jgi:ABC-type branched-subunit amino acid transport system substrate-binding protein
MTGLRVALTLDLTGRYAVQVRQARSGLELWAGDDHIELHVHDDAGSPTVAAAAYREFLADDFNIVLGPYGSGPVRHVAADACRTHRLLRNHGGAADDRARPGVISVPAPAST